MAVKTYKPRIDLKALETEEAADTRRFRNRSDEVLQWLWDTHVAFNEGVNYLAAELLRMRRGAGVWRERKDGIWSEWQPVSDLQALLAIRLQKQNNSSAVGLVENADLLNRFRQNGKTENEAVSLALCCASIFQNICPPSEEGEQVQMPRGALDLLTLSDSEAMGIRTRGTTKSGKEKKASGKRPGWLLDKAIAEECRSSASLDALFGRLRQREEFQSAKRDGERRIEKLRNQFQENPWSEAHHKILQQADKWPEKKEKADRKNAEEAALYRRLCEANCLPLPGFERPQNRLGLEGGKSEWNYAVWNMAGQRVRSHLGWVRRRSNEHLLWHREKKLFEEGGWIRTKEKGKEIKPKDRRPEHIVFSESSDDSGDYEQRPGYSAREWFKQLRDEYEGVEMPRLFASLSFGASGLPRINKRMLRIHR